MNLGRNAPFWGFMKIGSFISALLEPLGIRGEHEFLATILIGILVVMLAFLHGLLTYVIYVRLRHRMARMQDPQLRPFFDLLIAKILRGPTENQRLKIQDEAQIRLRRKSDRWFFRRILLKQIRSCSPKEKADLLRFYQCFGFLGEDLKEIRNAKWWIRIRALLRLENLRDPSLRPTLLGLIEDENEMVALAAIRAAGAVSQGHEVTDLLDYLSRRAPSRLDVFVEILRGLGNFDSAEVIKYLDSCFDPYIASVCISILGDLKAKNAVPYLLALLRSHEDSVVQRSAEALGKIGASEALPHLEVLLGHPSPNIRSTTGSPRARTFQASMVTN
jgi:hypothetical protein